MRQEFEPTIRPGHELEDIIKAISKAEPDDVVIYHRGAHGSVPGPKVRAVSEVIANKKALAFQKAGPRQIDGKDRVWQFVLVKLRGKK